MDLVGGKGLAGPGLLISSEKGKGVGSYCFGIEDSIANATACTHMCTNEFHELKIVVGELVLVGNGFFRVIAPFVGSGFAIGSHPYDIDDK